jgi:menaquinol-cytochrome c reductase iron-sulfur subunit
MNETVYETPEKNSLSRRTFLSIATWAIGGLISAALGIPAIAYIIGPALKRSTTQEWILLGSTVKVELGTPTLFKAKIERKTGWIVNEEEISAYALTDNGRDFIALSNICTHLGCRVRWVADQNKFFCPCHNGVYDKNGNVVSGPPPRPLDHYEVKIENNQLFIKGS